MALYDYPETRKRFIQALATKGRKTEWLRNNILLPGESEEDLAFLIDELKSEGLVHNQYGYWHLITKESEARRNQDVRKEEADTFLWAFWHPDNDALRGYIIRALNKEDGMVFRTLATLLMKERRPRIGMRPIGSLTDEERKRNDDIMERVNAYIDKKREQSGRH